MNRWEPEELAIVRALLLRGRSYEMMALVLPRHTARSIQDKTIAMGWTPRKRSREVPKVRNGVLTLSIVPGRKEVASGRGSRERQNMRRAARVARTT